MEKNAKIFVILASLLVVDPISGIAVQEHFNGSSSIELEVLPSSEDNSTQPLYLLSIYVQATRLLWKNRLEGFLNEYREDSGMDDAGSERVACSYDEDNVRGEKQVCDVPLDIFDICTQGSHSICVFLRLNKTLNWTPVPYNTVVGGLPANMPEDLKNHIQAVQGRREANTVWVSCEGETPADKEFIGPLQYIPRRGFPTYYFPNTNQTGYLSPLIAVKFDRPATGILINIECSAWAKDKKEGVVNFSMMVD